MKILLLFALIILAVADDDSNLTFSQWQIKHRVIVPIREIRVREKIFEQTKNLIDIHNAANETYTLGLNAFSHLTGPEFIVNRCGTILPHRLVENKNSTMRIGEPKIVPPPPFGTYTASTAPTSANFTSLMQPVLTQGNCGACWAFTAMGQLEGMMKIRNSTYQTVLSPQYLIDCDSNEAGCLGGWPTDAMYWLQTSVNNKAPSLSTYPYRGSSGTCRTPLTQVLLNINVVNENYLGGDETALKVQVANYGPTVVTIQVTAGLQSYRSGVFYDANCPSGSYCGQFNHAVIVVGYGMDPAYGEYWLVKNSWGTTWGENGYIRMARNRNNNCNIACYAIFSQ